MTISKECIALAGRPKRNLCLAGGNSDCKQGLLPLWEQNGANLDWSYTPVGFVIFPQEFLIRDTWQLPLDFQFSAEKYLF